MSSVKNDGVVFVPSASVTDCANKLICASNTKILVVVLSIFLPLETTRTVSFFSGLFSLPSMGSRDRASVAWCLTPARCSTPESNLERRNRQLASLPVASAKFKIH